MWNRKGWQLKSDIIFLKNYIVHNIEEVTTKLKVTWQQKVVVGDF